MASPAPLVLESTGVADFVQYVLQKHTGQSTLVVCSSKENFIKHLQASTAERQNDRQEEGDDIGTNQSNTVLSAGLQETSAERHALSAATLRLLASCQTVRVAFCPEVRHLRAYLATYALYNSQQESLFEQRTSNDRHMLAILNPIQPHRQTSAFSAQGLNRTLSVAVEAAHGTGGQLVLAECFEDVQTNPPEDPSILFEEEDQAPAASSVANVWDEEISILNVATKSFGAGERGWVGRTVKTRTIAERWCTFETPSAHRN